MVPREMRKSLAIAVAPRPRGPARRDAARAAPVTASATVTAGATLSVAGNGSAVVQPDPER